MLIYAFRKSDMCYSGTVEVPDDTVAIPQYHTFQAPPEQDGYHAVMRGGWVLEEGPTPPDPQPEIDLNNWRFSAFCTPFQGRVALISAGKMSEVEAIINDPSTPQETRIAWEYALEWRRMSPMIINLSTALGMTDEQVDDLFREAKNITA